MTPRVEVMFGVTLAFVVLITWRTIVVRLQGKADETRVLSRINAGMGLMALSYLLRIPVFSHGIETTAAAAVSSIAAIAMVLLSTAELSHIAARRNCAADTRKQHR